MANPFGRYDHPPIMLATMLDVTLALSAGAATLPLKKSAEVSETSALLNCPAVARVVSQPHLTHRDLNVMSLAIAKNRHHVACDLLAIYLD